MIGRVVGKYKLLEQIGEGGMGVVYRGEHVMLGSPAAIKILLPQFTQYDPAQVDRLFTEAKMTSAIRHPGIVQVFDFGRLDDGQAFIVMELLRGEDLTGFLQARHVLEPALATQITLQLLSALEAAHVAGVVHRDLKPDNIYLIRDPTAPGAIRVKVLDFGIAKLVGPKPKTKTAERAIVGTPAYMAPEQCKGSGEIDARADLYAVGCILFHMLTGRPPFEGEGSGDVMAKHIYEPPPRLPGSLPPELDALLAKMLAKSPAERTPSAAWALAALERVPLPDLSIEVPLMGPRVQTAGALTDGREPWPRWIPIVVIVGALIVAGVLVVVIAFA